LTQIQEKVDSVARLPVKWSDQLKELLREHERPPISELNRLLAIAETSGELLDEMVDLKAFLNDAGHWIENISRIFGKRKGPRNSNINSGLSEVEKLFGTEKTLSNFRFLLAKANQMALECPEVHILNDAIGQAEEYQKRLALLLNDPNVSLAALNDMHNEAIMLDIGMEEFSELMDKKRSVEWEENSKTLISGKEEEIKPFIEMIKSGLEIGITQDHPQMVALTKIKSLADAWRDQAHNIFRSKLKIDSLLEIERILLDGKLTPYYKATMQQLEQLYNSIQSWYQKASEIFEIKHSGDTLVIGKLKTQNYELVKQILMESEALSMSLEIPEILETIAVTETWLQRGKKVLCRPRSSKSFQMVLSDLLKNVEIFANTHISIESVCFCRTEAGDQSPEIVCLDCNHSYHASCLGITKKVMSNMTDFVCFVCNGKFDAMKRDSKLPSLMELQAYLSEGQSLPLIPPEVSVMEKIVENLISFKKFVFEFLAKDGSDDKSNLKNLLRSSAGLDVIIDPEMAQLRKQVERIKVADNDDKEIHMDKAGPRYCICREVYTADKPMIGCDQCSEWYHWDCLGLSSRNVDALRDVGFICTLCNTQNTSNKKSEKHSKILSSSDAHNRRKIPQMEKNSPICETENCTDDAPVQVFKVRFNDNNITETKVFRA
jgi:hypothetical protein